MLHAGWAMQGQVQNENAEPLFKKSEGSIAKGPKIECFFLFSVASFLACQGVFLLFNVILSKEILNF